MAFCLEKALAKKFQEAVDNGTLDPEKLAVHPDGSLVSTAERLAIFEAVLGKNAAGPVNTLFEEKLILKNQVEGMNTWVKQMAHGYEKTTAGKGILAKIEALTSVIDPTNEEAFLGSLVKKRLGFELSPEQFKKIGELSKDMTNAKMAYDPAKDAWDPKLTTHADGTPTTAAEQAKMTPQGLRTAYAKAIVELQDFVGQVKQDATDPSLVEKTKNPIALTGLAGETFAGLMKGLSTMGDLAAFGRQGIVTMYNHPYIFFKNAFLTLVDVAKQLASAFKDPWLNGTSDLVTKAIRGHILSDPLAMDGTLQKMGLKVGGFEEARPDNRLTRLVKRIPVLGALYTASDVAYNGFLFRLRLDIAKLHYRVMTGQGGDILFSLFPKFMKGSQQITDAELAVHGELINSMTGQPSLGRTEGLGRVLNVVFFSLKTLKGHVDTLTAHTFTKGFRSGQAHPYTRYRAARNLLQLITGLAAVMLIHRALDKKAVTFDAANADFGKIRKKNTRFDISSGMGNLITLAARLIENRMVSSSTGKVIALNTLKFGEPTTDELFMDFLVNRLSTTATVAHDLFVRHDRNGNPLTVKGEAINLAAPLGARNYQELMTNPQHADILGALIWDNLGVATNTYSAAKKIDNIFRLGRYYNVNDAVNQAIHDDNAAKKAKTTTLPTAERHNLDHLNTMTLTADKAIKAYEDNTDPAKEPALREKVRTATNAVVLYEKAHPVSGVLQ